MQKSKLIGHILGKTIPLPEGMINLSNWMKPQDKTGVRFPEPS